MMLAAYANLPRVVGPSLATLLNRIAQDHRPALVQCTVGKDRTGFTVACILRALDVLHDDILADYLLTREHVDVVAMRPVTGAFLGELLGLDLSPACIDVLNGVDADYLGTAFATVERQYGSFDAYLREFGVSSFVVERLRDALLVPAR